MEHKFLHPDYSAIGLASKMWTNFQWAFYV